MKMKILYLKIVNGELKESELMNDFVQSKYKDFEKTQIIADAFREMKEIPKNAQLTRGIDYVKYVHYPSKTVYYIQLLKV